MNKETIFDVVSEQSGDLAAFIKNGKETAADPTPLKHKETQTVAQLVHRMQFCNIQATVSIMAYNIRGGFQSKPKNLTYPNMFVKRNLTGNEKVYLSKSEITAKACVAARYQITEGTLPSVELMKQNDLLVSSLRIPQGESITENTTLGEVSAMLLRTNSDLCLRDQISIVHEVQRFVTSGTVSIPRVALKLHEFTLDTTSLVPFYTLIPEHLFLVTNGGYIATDANGEEGAIAYVVSRRKAGKLLISPQYMVITPGNSVYKTYTSEAKKAEALKSFDTGSFYFYDPESSDTRQDPEDAYFTLTAVTLNGTLVPKDSGELDVSSGDSLEIKGSKLTDVELKASVTVGGPTASPTTVALSSVGTITATSDTSITIHITMNGEINHLLRADSATIIYNFG
jgi:hypothetical protein